MNNIVNNTTTANVINTSDIATNRNIVLCGVRRSGNCPQASKLLAAAAMSKDIPVMSAETIGMTTWRQRFQSFAYGKKSIFPNDQNRNCRSYYWL